MKVLKNAGKALSVLIVVFMIAVLCFSVVQRVTGNVPGMFGFHMMYVLTGSMEPEIMAGDAVLVKECGAEGLKAGQIISYYGTAGDSGEILITHKLVEDPWEENGVLMLRTKGTANALPDEPFSEDRLFGKVLCRVPLLGKIYRFFCTVPGLIVAVLPILGTIVAEIINIIKTMNDGEE